MTLVPLHSNVTSSNTYPDKVRVHFQYQLPEQTTFYHVRDFFHDRGFYQIPGRGVLRETVEGNQSGFLFDVMLSYAQRVSRLHVYVDLNALRKVHADVGTPENETSLNWDTNWLPTDQIEPSNRRIWQIADDLIWDAEATLTPIVEQLVRERGRPILGVYREASVSSVEVSVDFAANNPLQAIDDLRPNFQQQIRQLHLSGYRPTTNSYETQEGNAQMLHGHLRRHERYKAYTKTNRRIRLECEFGTEAFYRYRISRSLAEHNNSFVHLFEAVAEQCIPVFNALTEGGVSNGANTRTATELLLAIGRVCRDESRANGIVQLLAQNGRITSDFGYRYLRPLVQQGILTRTQRGIYAPAPCWGGAIRQVMTFVGNAVGGMAQ